MSPDTSPAENAPTRETAGGDDAPGRTGADPLAEPLAEPDEGVAVDDHSDQVDLNSEQWDAE